ncbi:MAG: tRNA (adenosine(37)-N6)-dimethylallyltransferase MiaA [Bacteroidota bacterium]
MDNQERGAPPAPPILTLTGPTGVGKTSLSLPLADLLKAEILSIDSRQIYKELNIGTAKPDTNELARAPHHFISERSIADPISSGQFASMAEQRIQEVHNRGKVPLLVGGSTLYLQALQKGIADIPDIDPSVRQHLVTRLEKEGNEALYNELLSADPDAAATMDATKTQRLVRALEVFHGTGNTLSFYHAQTPPARYLFKTIVLTRPREVLYERIENRIDMMLDAGLVDEVGDLMGMGLDMAMPVLKTIGYREVVEHLQGMYGFDEMVRLLKRNTRRYAKRQLTWFRRFPEYIWIDRHKSDDQVINEILGALAAQPDA